MKNKDVIDIIIFGSAAKGKTLPRDIDIAIITEKDVKYEVNGFHISFLRPIDFVHKPPTIVTTLLKEGYSIRENKELSEIYRFKSRSLFVYTLESLNNSEKVRIVTFLRGKNNLKGLVREYFGEWLSNNTFISPQESDYVLDQFFIANKIRFRKFNILLH